MMHLITSQHEKPPSFVNVLVVVSVISFVSMSRQTL
jgi:hypothetical protein